MEGLELKAVDTLEENSDVLDSRSANGQANGDDHLENGRPEENAAMCSEDAELKPDVESKSDEQKDVPEKELASEERDDQAIDSQANEDQASKDQTSEDHMNEDQTSGDKTSQVTIHVTPADQKDTNGPNAGDASGQPATTDEQIKSSSQLEQST